MSNIHGLSNLNSNNNPASINQNAQHPNNQSFANIPMLYAPTSQTIEPRKENFCQFLKLVCCPTFTFKSFVFLITCFNIIYFIIELSMSSNISGEFLQPDALVMKQLGAKYPYNMKKGYIWLFMTPMIMHANFLHILTNSISILIFGTNLEKSIGLIRTIIIYIISGISGNLFSAVVSDDLSVGASTCIFGLIGSQLSFLIINWESLRPLGFLRCQMLIGIIAILILNLLVGLGTKLIDNYGHIGGLIGGVLIGFVVLNPISFGIWERRLRIFGIIAFGLFWTILLLVFYLGREPKQLFY